MSVSRFRNRITLRAHSCPKSGIVSASRVVTYSIPVNTRQGQAPSVIILGLNLEISMHITMKPEIQLK